MGWNFLLPVIRRKEEMSSKKTHFGGQETLLGKPSYNVANVSVQTLAVWIRDSSELDLNAQGI